jgi:D-arabinan exo alpha-(1,3)/(1,5)-arabinofuranosidase (non-reducing end)
MITNSGLSPLRGLAKLRDVRSRRFSSFDRTGGNDDRFHIQSGETLSIAEVGGAGIVTHIWSTVPADSEPALREIVFRAFWDGEENPSIECPLGDFLGPGPPNGAILSVYPSK